MLKFTLLLGLILSLPLNIATSGRVVENTAWAPTAKIELLANPVLVKTEQKTCKNRSK